MKSITSYTLYRYYKRSLPKTVFLKDMALIVGLIILIGTLDLNPIRTLFKLYPVKVLYKLLRKNYKTEKILVYFLFKFPVIK